MHPFIRSVPATNATQRQPFAGQYGAWTGTEAWAWLQAKKGARGLDTNFRLPPAGRNWQPRQQYLRAIFRRSVQSCDLRSTPIHARDFDFQRHAVAAAAAAPVALARRRCLRPQAARHRHSNCDSCIFGSRQLNPALRRDQHIGPTESSRLLYVSVDEAA
ncbi:hypothetical protein L1887_48025 [Cichorium endivia]|nr:hypothetical protein L1887_48025 [Cichorium endivia]